MWYQWDDLESFDAWHKEICENLGIPNENN
jgi:hypothetical protein